MSQITIDHQTVEQICEHCHKEYKVSRGSAYNDGIGFGIYLGALHQCHSGRSVHLALAIREGYANFEETRAIALHIWASESEIKMSIVDSCDSPWKDEAYLGRIMNRDEALSSALTEKFFHVADHIVSENQLINKYLTEVS